MFSLGEYKQLLVLIIWTLSFGNILDRSQLCDLSLCLTIRKIPHFQMFSPLENRKVKLLNQREKHSFLQNSKKKKKRIRSANLLLALNKEKDFF